MSGEAHALFDEAERALIDVVDAADALAPALAAHLSKHSAMIARVALTFHAISCDGDPAAQDISGPCMALAIRFMKKARRHGASVYSALSGRQTNAANLAKSLAVSALDARLTCVADQ